MRNPWTKIGGRLVYQNPWIRLREDQVIRPDGSDGIYGVIEAKVAVGVIALTEHNQVVLVGQYRYTIDEYSWEIIEGGAEEHECPLDAGRRELREEAGLIASEWLRLGDRIHLSNCFSSEVAYLFLARKLERVKCAPDATEVLTTQELPLEEALQLVRLGQITDSMSIIGLYRLHDYLRLP